MEDKKFKDWVKNYENYKILENEIKEKNKLKQLTIKEINQQLYKDFGIDDNDFQIVKISYSLFTGYVLKIYSKKYKKYDIEKHKSFIWNNGEIKFNYLELKKDIKKILKVVKWWK